MNKAIHQSIYMNREERKSLIYFLVLIFIYISFQVLVDFYHRPTYVDYSIYDGLFQPVTEQNIESSTIQKDKTYPKQSNSQEIAIISEDQLASRAAIPTDTIPPLMASLGRIETRAQSQANDFKMETNDNAVNQTPPEKPDVMIDINTADEVELQYLHGIGPSFASRIVKYRGMVGGFHSIDQLAEVYGFDYEKLAKIREMITVSDNIQYLDINTDDVSTLRHPYIKYAQAKVIVAYRKQHGPYTTADQLLQIRLLDTFFVNKIRPYLPKEMRGNE